MVKVLADLSARQLSFRRYKESKQLLWKFLHISHELRTGECKTHAILLHNGFVLCDPFYILQFALVLEF